MTGEAEAAAGRRLGVVGDATVVALAAAGEFWLLVRLMIAPERLAAPLFGHLIISLGVALYAGHRYRRKCRRPQIFLFALSTAALGPVGVGGFFIQFLLHALFRRSATPFETWYRSLFPELERNRTRTLYETIALHRTNLPARSSVASFNDVLAGGTVRQKQLMIGMIADQFRPAYAPVLRRSLNDAEPAIRVQAATAVAKIEARFMEEAMKLETALKAAADGKTRMDLIACYEAYAGSGLLDPTRASALCRKALELCDEGLERDPRDVEQAAARGRLLVKLGRADEAVAILLPLAAEDDAAPEILSDLRSALQACGRYHEVRRVAARLWCAGDRSEYGSTVAFWARPDLTEGGS